MNDGQTFDSKTETELRMMIREKIAPFASPDYIQSAPGLPKTRSGKIMRRVLKKIANDEKDLGDISTMADSTVVQVSTASTHCYQPNLTLTRRSCLRKDLR